MAIIQPFSFQFCTAFRERKQLADKTNEIIEVLNSADLENLPTEIEELDAKIEDYNTTQSQNLLNLSDYVDAERVIIVNRLNAIEEDIDEIKNPNWILCPSDMDLYDYETSKISHDLKIVYSIPYDVRPTYAQNLITYHMTGTIYFKKDDIIDLDNIIITGQGFIMGDNVNLNIGIGLSISTIAYGMSHDPYAYNIHGIAIDPVNNLTTDRATATTINYQTNKMVISNSNPFVNVYYKGE